jgi:hypothetical protein
MCARRVRSKAHVDVTARQVEAKRRRSGDARIERGRAPAVRRTPQARPHMVDEAFRALTRLRPTGAY